MDSSQKLTTFSLGEGQWVVIAKASVKGYGGNTGHVDCRLKIVGEENIAGLPNTFSAHDESYESPSPSMGSTVMVTLPIKIYKSADFYVEGGAQAGIAELVHFKICAFRDSTTS